MENKEPNNDRKRMTRSPKSNLLLNTEMAADDIGEDGLVKITSTYKQINSFSTLRLPVNFKKLQHLDEVKFAYSVLQEKGRERSKYLAQVVNYCDEHHTNTNAEMRAQISYLRHLKMIKEKHEIKTRDDIIRLLSTDKNSEEYKNIKKNSLQILDPANSMFGFSKKNNASRRAFNRLYDLDPSDKIMTISRDVRQYLDEGFDLPMQIQLMNLCLKETIDDYHNYPDDPYLIQNFSLMMELSEKIVETRSVATTKKNLKTYDNVTDEISSLFANDTAFEEWLR